MPDLSDTIEQLTDEPQAASVDGQSSTNQDISKVIEADKYLGSKTALSGTNSNGGPVSGWNNGVTRAARYRYGGDCR